MEAGGARKNMKMQLGNEPPSGIEVLSCSLLHVAAERRYKFKVTRKSGSMGT